MQIPLEKSWANSASFWLVSSTMELYAIISSFLVKLPDRQWKVMHSIVILHPMTFSQGIVFVVSLDIRAKGVT